MEIKVETYDKERSFEKEVRNFFNYHKTYKKHYHEPKGFCTSDKLLPYFHNADLIIYDEKNHKYLPNPRFQKDFNAFKETFFNEVYNEDEMKNCAKITEERVVPYLREKESILQQLQLNNKGFYLPDHLTISITGLRGGGWYNPNDEIALAPTPEWLKEEGGILAYQKQCLHEFTHLCIEQGIIKELKVPQPIKERLVDKIMFECLGVEESGFSNSCSELKYDDVLSKDNLLFRLDDTIKCIMKEENANLLVKNNFNNRKTQKS